MDIGNKEQSAMTFRNFDLFVPTCSFSFLDDTIFITSELSMRQDCTDIHKGIPEIKHQYHTNSSLQQKPCTKQNTKLKTMQIQQYIVFSPWNWAFLLFFANMKLFWDLGTKPEVWVEVKSGMNCIGGFDTEQLHINFYKNVS